MVFLVRESDGAAVARTGRAVRVWATAPRVPPAANPKAQEGPRSHRGCGTANCGKTTWNDEGQDA
ncbi:hypothetical protein GCM10027601_11900 [Nocardioides ungokensis]